MSAQSTSLADSPFDADDADIIIRSSDLVDFRLHKVILSLASSVFKDMLSLPQPSDASPGDIPLVTLSEDSQTLETIFHFCYPVPAPIVMTFEHMHLVLQAADKYNIQRATELIRLQLTTADSRCLESDPVGVYCFACRYGWESEARLAARNTLRFNTITQSGTHDQQLALITAVPYKRLLVYHDACSKVAGRIAHGDFQGWKAIKDVRFPPRCNGCSMMNAYLGDGRSLPQWFVHALNDISAEFEETPSGANLNQPKHVELAMRRIRNCATCTRDLKEGEVSKLLDAFDAEVKWRVSQVVPEFDSLSSGR